jgi:hypothetical protein
MRGRIETGGTLSGGNGRSGGDGSPCDGGRGGGGGDASAAGSGAGGEPGTTYDGESRCREVDGNGGEGGRGGAGAGGGVLLQAPDVVVTGAIDARDGRGGVTGGGSVMVFHRGVAPDLSGVQAGRIFRSTY